MEGSSNRPFEVYEQSPPESEDERYHDELATERNWDSRSLLAVEDDEDEGSASNWTSFPKGRSNSTTNGSGESGRSKSVDSRERRKSNVSISLIDESAVNNDFEALRQGIDFALGSNDKKGEWLTGGNISHESVDKVDRNADSQTLPLMDDEYEENILLDDLKEGGNERRALSFLSPFEDPSTRGRNSVSTAGSHQNIFQRRQDDLEKGLPKLTINTTIKDSIPPPNKITGYLSRLSDRVAGSGLEGSNPSTPIGLSPSALSTFGLKDSSSHKDPTPSPRSHHSKKTDPSQPCDEIDILQVSPLRRKYSGRRFSSNNPFYDDEVERPEVVSDGLGLYLDHSTDSIISKSRSNSVSPTQSFSDSGSKKNQQQELPVEFKAESKINSKNGSNILFGKSLGVFSAESDFRKVCYNVATHKVTNSILLAILIVQIGLLSYRQWNPMKKKGYMFHGYNWADYILIAINLIYTIEIIIKIIAYGLIDDDVLFEKLEIERKFLKRSYIIRLFIRLINFLNLKFLLRQSWFRRLDNDENSRSTQLDEEYRKLGSEGGYDSSGYNESHHYLHSKYPDLSSHHNTFSDIQDDTFSSEGSVALVSNVEPQGNVKIQNTFMLNRNNDTSTTYNRAYLRNSWQRIDFLSAMFFWISLILSYNRYDAKHQITLFRSLSCLRILRLCNLTTGTSTILAACKLAIPQLIDVSIFISCFWLFFGIIGVQSFKSSFTRHCVWENPDDPSDKYTNSDQYCGSFIDIDGSARPYINRDGTYSKAIKGFRCPKYSKCISGENPYGGTVNFDNILQSLQLVFVVMSANTFTDLMYMTMDSDNVAACLFFIFGIFILTVWLINILIAVIVASFNVTRLETVEKPRKKEQGRRIWRLFGSENKEQSIRNERIEALKKRNVLLKNYYRFEFLFVSLIVADLVVQCFRRYNLESTGRHALYRIEAAFTVTFLCEAVFRLLIYYPEWKLFFISRRNCFDLFLGIITGIIIIGPVKDALGHGYYWLTVFQLMRFYRVVLATPFTRNLWLKIMGNIKAIYDLALFYFILTYLVSIIMARYFEGAIPAEDIESVDLPMHTLPDSFVALYVITSTENWSEIMYNLQQYAKTTSSRAFGSMFLISWFILSNMVILNIFIAVIAKTLEVSQEGKRKRQLLQFIDNMTERLQSFEGETGLSRFKNKVFKKRGVQDEWEKTVVNLLLSGSAVNDFLDADGNGDATLDEDLTIRNLYSSGWKRFLQVHYWRTKVLLKNPFYGHQKEPELKMTNFNPANFARNVISERNALISEQNKFLKDNPNYNTVFYVMGPRHRIRRMCQKIVRPSHGERIDGVEPNKKLSEAYIVAMFFASIAVVISACYLTPLYRKEMTEKYGTINWILYLEVGFIVVFTVEFIIKILADGLLFTPNAYMRSSWNLIDLCVLISLWIEFIAFMKNDGKLTRIVRGLKALRALRLLTISQTAKNNFHNTMISGFRKIINAAVISLTLLFPFAIWGLNIFNGRLGYCLDGTSDLKNCYNEYDNQVFNWNVRSPNVYTHPQLEYNRFSSAFATSFEIVSLEGWEDLLMNVMKSTGVGTVPRKNATPLNGVFVILFNFIGIIFILTLFVSVIISNYSRTTGRAYMTDQQVSWYQIKKFLSQVKPSKRKNHTQLNWIRRFCYKMTVEKYPLWNNILTFILFLHVLSLLLDCYPTYDGLKIYTFSISLLASVAFFLNTSMLLFAQGLRTFVHYKWNVFYLIISLGAVTTTPFTIIVDDTNLYTNFNQLFLVAILAFIIPRSNRLSQLLRFASASLPALISLSFTWTIIFLVYAIAMNQIFGLTKVGPNGSGNLNFRSVSKALIALFRCSFGESWNYIMEDYTLEAPYCTIARSLDDSDCGNKQYSYILFISWNIVSMYIFVNMFISLILDSFSYINHSTQYSHLIKREEIRRFKKTWRLFDPKGEGFIKVEDLPKLLRLLDGSLSLRGYSGSLSIPELTKKWIQRHDMNNPYDISTNLYAINKILNEFDVEKIRQRRKLFERFIEEATLNMELNNEPGISFQRIIIQIPLYNSFDPGQCLNLIDFIERRLLLQKVQKRLDRKTVFNKILTYACRWKYKHRQFNDLFLAVNTKFNNSKESVETKDNKTPSIFVTESEGPGTPKTNRGLISKSSENVVEENDKNAGSASGVYIPKSPVQIYNARQRYNSSGFSELSSPPKFSIQMPPSTENTTESTSGNIVSDRDSRSVNNMNDNNVSLVDLSGLGEDLKNPSWK